MPKFSFGDDSSAYHLLGVEHERCQKKRFGNFRWQNAVLVFGCILLIVNIALMASIFHKVTMKHNISNYEQVNIASNVYAGEALEWELRTLDEVFHDHESLYRGSARPELDEAWQKLMKGYDLRVPYPGWTTPTSPNFTMVRLNDDTKDGMAVPSVLHQLHCLRTIREYFLPEHYPRTAFRYPHDPGEINVHIDHCLDTLRQNVMCSADMTLMSYEWWDRTPYPQIVPGSLHKCANWKRLTNWMQEHSFSPYGPILTHPKTNVVPRPWDGEDPAPTHNSYWESKGEPWNKFPRET